MKICPKCNAENKNQGNFCQSCGENVENITPQSEDNIASDLLQKADKIFSKETFDKAKEKIGEAATSAKEKYQDTQQSKAAVSELKKQEKFVDPSESVVAIIGANYAQNVLTGGSVKKGYAILTQKRLYYKGKSFSSVGKQISSDSEECIVDINDVTFTKFIYTEAVGMSFLSIICFLGGIALTYFAMPFLGIPLVLIGIVFLIKSFTRKQTLFGIFFPGGKFTFDVRWYPKADMMDFQRQLHLIKDVKRYGAN